ncbi:MAG TPA: MarR family transcriptional regulator [Bacteroidales bacterium]|nr:MarR family transcriptional regulator [Bacteroidales bacterium]HPS17849.1 MarR family transcriptional regulator [Bacteroidales bacterium]
MEKKNIPLGMIICRMMHEMFRVLKKQAFEQTEIKLSLEQFGLLHTINMKSEDVIQNDMAKMMGRDKSSILRLIDSLEEKELVRRVVDKNDRRKNYLMVTKKGEKIIEQYLEIEFKLVKELQDGLSKSDIETFYKVINHIKSNAEKL